MAIDPARGFRLNIAVRGIDFPGRRGAVNELAQEVSEICTRTIVSLSRGTFECVVTTPQSGDFKKNLSRKKRRGDVLLAVNIFTKKPIRGDGILEALRGQFPEFSFL